MTGAATGLLLAAALLAREAQSVEDREPVQETAHVDEDGKYGWRCWAPVAVGGHAGKVWRDYHKRSKNAAYVMQMGVRGYGDRYEMMWTVDPRPEGPPAKDRNPSTFSLEEAFRSGPETISIEFKWEGAVVGPLWVHYWGNGVYAGGEMLMSARSVRRWFGNSTVRTGTNATPGAAVKARLAPARTWTALVRDSKGRQLDSKTFDVPTPSEAGREFRRARARIDAVELRFRTDHTPLDEGDVSCSDFDDPQSIAEI